MLGHHGTESTRSGLTLSALYENKNITQTILATSKMLFHLKLLKTNINALADRYHDHMEAA